MRRLSTRCKKQRRKYEKHHKIKYLQLCRNSCWSNNHTPSKQEGSIIVKEFTKKVNDGVKDGAYYCYCTYVLRISRYSDFLSLMLTNTGIFLRGLKLSGESRS